MTQTIPSEVFNRFIEEDAKRADVSRRYTELTGKPIKVHVNRSEIQHLEGTSGKGVPYSFDKMAVEATITTAFLNGQQVTLEEPLDIKDSFDVSPFKTMRNPEGDEVPKLDEEGKPEPNKRFTRTAQLVVKGCGQEMNGGEIDIHNMAAAVQGQTFWTTLNLNKRTNFHEMGWNYGQTPESVMKETTK